MANLDEILDQLRALLPELRKRYRVATLEAFAVTRDLRGLRGKLEMGAMATRALRARGLSSCTYEKLSHDVLHNRILRLLPARASGILRRPSRVERTVTETVTPIVTLRRQIA